MRVAIVGYGLLGRLCALELSDVAQVEVFTAEKSGCLGGAGWKAAAMLAPIAESVEAGPLISEAGGIGLQRWPQILTQLDDQVWFQKQGSLVLAHQQDQHLLTQFRQRLCVSSTAAIERLDQAHIQRLEPGVSEHFTQGLFLPGEGQLDNRAFFKAVDKTLQRRKVKMHWNTPLSLPGSMHRPVSVLGVKYDWVIDCRGIGAKQELSALRGVRGEIVRVSAPDVSLQHPIRLVHPRYPLYVAPKPEHEFVLGATQIESEDESPISIRSALELLSAAFSLCSGFAEARILSCEAALRPAYSDNHPALFCSDGFIRINGLYRHGFLLGPLFSGLAKDMILNTSNALPDKLRERFVHPIYLPHQGTAHAN